jgi:hypothetical protein
MTSNDKKLIIFFSILIIISIIALFLINEHCVLISKQVEQLSLLCTDLTIKNAEISSTLDALERKQLALTAENNKISWFKWVYIKFFK